jgi:hypothetical protein
VTSKQIKDLFTWEDKRVQDVMAEYPDSVQERLRATHPTTAIIYNAIDEITKARAAEGRIVTRGPTVREIAGYIEKNHGVSMQHANIHRHHLDKLEQTGLIVRERDETGTVAHRGIVITPPGELPAFSPEQQTGEQSAGNVWDDVSGQGFSTPTVFNVNEEGGFE